MPTRHREAKISARHLVPCVSLVVVAIAAVIICAIFFRPGGFKVEAQGQGVTVKLAFDDSRVDLGEFLNQLLKKVQEATPTAVWFLVFCRRTAYFAFLARRLPLS
jgi:hypothetical protein